MANTFYTDTAVGDSTPQTLAEKIADITDYAWVDIAKAAKASMVNSAVGGSEYRMPDGRMLRRLTMEEAKTLYAMAIQMINAETDSDTGGGIALVQFGDIS